MDLNEDVIRINKIIPNIDKLIAAWKIEQVIDNRKTFIVPSEPFLDYYMTCIFSHSNSEETICGIDLNKFNFLHSLIVWSMKPKKVVIAPESLRLVFKSNIVNKVDRDILFSFPSQAILVDQKIGSYDAILYSKDYFENENGGYTYFLSINLLSKSSKGFSFGFILPDSDEIDPFEVIKINPELKHLTYVFSTLLYILSCYSQREDITSNSDKDYLGFEMSRLIKEKEGCRGQWRNMHWHTYHVIENGVSKKIFKFLKPTWVDG